MIQKADATGSGKVVLAVVLLGGNVTTLMVNYMEHVKDIAMDVPIGKHHFTKEKKED